MLISILFSLLRRDQSGAMAELSTLSPSPPALGDSHTAPSITLPPSPLPASNSSAPESAKEVPNPKSSLYNDKALKGNCGAQSESSPLSPTKVSTDTHRSPLLQDATPHKEKSPGKDADTEDHVIKEMTSDPAAAQLLNSESETQALSSEPSAESEMQPASPSPDLNSGPNLYPNVHVTHNPNVGTDVGEISVDQPQTTSGSSPTPAPPASTDSAVTAEEKKPQPLQQAQIPESLPPSLSPKPDPTCDSDKAELPTSPTRADHSSPTVPLIHEPACGPPLPNTYSRPAPDTLSYLESASLMSGTLESLSGLGEDGSSVGSDSEINGLTVRRTDKYGFLGGSQYSEGR